MRNQLIAGAAGLFIASMVLGACSSTQDVAQKEQEETTVFTREMQGENVVVHSSLGFKTIKDWRVIDDRTLIIDTYREGELIARFFAPCPGVRFALTLGFKTMGPFDLDRTTRVVLPDGQVCTFKSLQRYIKPEGSSND